MRQEASIIYLQRLANDADTARLGINVNGPPKPGSHSSNELLRKVTQWQANISAMQKSIKSKAHFTEMTAGPNAQRTGGHPVKDQHRSQMNNVKALQTASLAARNSVNGLLNAIYGPENAEKTALDAIAKGLKEMFAGDENLDLSPRATQEFREVVVKPAMDQTAPTGPALMPPGPIDMLLVIGGLLAMIKARLKKSDD